MTQRSLHGFGTGPSGSGPLPWGEVKKRLRGKTEKELIKLLGDCYRTSPDVRVKLSLAVSGGKRETKAIVSELKARLHHEFCTTNRNGSPKTPDLKEARRIVSLARSSVDDPDLAVDLMLEHLKHGVDFTLRYGDMQTSYYASIESVFAKTCKYIAAHRSEIDLDAAMERIDEIFLKTNMIGWGFHDELAYIIKELQITLAGENVHDFVMR
jgi:hypothetical protein